jgi:hypothetical protein
VADRRLDLADGVGERKRLLLGGAEDVKRQSLGGALPDAGQASELRDEPVDGRCEHERQRLAGGAANSGGY